MPGFCLCNAGTIFMLFPIREAGFFGAPHCMLPGVPGLCSADSYVAPCAAHHEAPNSICGSLLGAAFQVKLTKPKSLGAALRAGHGSLLGAGFELITLSCDSLSHVPPKLNAW